jgi:hypothetical protein
MKYICTTTYTQTLPARLIKRKERRQKMGSHRISFSKEMNPGLTDYQLAEKLSAIEPREGGVIVRYKSSKNGSFDHFGSCGNIDMLKSYFSSSNCHDTEIIYIHPDVLLSLIPFGLKIFKDTPNGSKVYQLIQIEKQRINEKLEEKKRRKIEEEKHRIEKEKQKAEELRVS